MNPCAQDVLTRPAEEFGNDETLEHLWAARAMEHSDIYFNVSFWIGYVYLTDWIIALVFLGYSRFINFSRLNRSWRYLLKTDEHKHYNPFIPKINWHMYILYVTD